MRGLCVRDECVMTWQTWHCLGKFPRLTSDAWKQCKLSKSFTRAPHVPSPALPLTGPTLLLQRFIPFAPRFGTCLLPRLSLGRTLLPA